MHTGRGEGVSPEARRLRLETRELETASDATSRSLLEVDIYSNFQLLSVDKMGEERFDWGI